MAGNIIDQLHIGDISVSDFSILIICIKFFLKRQRIFSGGLLELDSHTRALSLTNVFYLKYD